MCGTAWVVFQSKFGPLDNAKKIKIPDDEKFCGSYQPTTNFQLI